jgi:hypothetical protein
MKKLALVIALTAVVALIGGVFATPSDAFLFGGKSSCNTYWGGYGGCCYTGSYCAPAYYAPYCGPYYGCYPPCGYKVKKKMGK